jgi:hypothetical protein
MYQLLLVVAHCSRVEVVVQLVWLVAQQVTTRLVLVGQVAQVMERQQQRTQVLVVAQAILWVLLVAMVFVM